MPPPADRFDRERRRAVAGAHVHEPGARARVADPVPDRVPALLTGEGVATDLHRGPLRPPFPPRLRILPDLLFLLGVHADHRLPGRQVLLSLGGDIPEPGIPVRMPPPLHDLGVGLGGEPLLVPQPPRGLRAAPVPGRGQLIRQAHNAPGRPRQRRLRIPARAILHQRQQRRHQPGTGPGQLLAAPARPADAPLRRDLPRSRLRRPVRDRLPRRPGHLRHRRDPAVPGRPRHRAQRQPPGLLIQHRQQQLQLRPHKLHQIRVRAHSSRWVLAAWGSRETWAAGRVRVVTGRRWWRQVCCPCACRRRDRFQGARWQPGCPAGACGDPGVIAVNGRRARPSGVDDGRVLPVTPYGPWRFAPG